MAGEKMDERSDSQWDDSVEVGSGVGGWWTRSFHLSPLVRRAVKFEKEQ
jgi:hypothetical protein